MDKPFISVCIITKNECSKIKRCLEALLQTGYELVVVDTGSTDGTIETVKNYTESIYEFPWIGDFAAAKNYAVSKAKSDIVMVVDSDEYLIDFDKKSFEQRVKRYNSAVGQISRKEEFINEKGESEQCMVRTERVYDRRNYHYAGRIHEQLTFGSTMSEDRDDTRKALYVNTGSIQAYDTGLVFEHDGYAGTMDERKGKAVRNAELLEEELKTYPDDPYVLYQLAKSYRITDGPEKALEYYKRVLGLDINPDAYWVQDMIVCYGYALLELERYDEALDLQAVYEEFKECVDYRFLMGLIYMNNALFEPAIESFLSCTKMDNARASGIGSYKAYFNAGVLKECLGDIEKAKEYYRKAGTYEPAAERLKSI